MTETMTQTTTQTTTQTEPPPQATFGLDTPVDASDILLSLIVTLLAPMFLCVSGGDIRFARSAALETVNSYRARTHADLLLIAQIIGFGLAALGSLSLSMTDDISLAMTMRLRGNANACNRSAEQNRRALTASRPNIPAAPGLEPSEKDFDEAAVVATVATTLKLATETQAAMIAARPAPNPAPTPAPTPDPVPRPEPHRATRAPTERERQVLWGAGAARIAAEYTASLAGLPHSERQAAMLKAEVLNRCANDLLSGNAPPRLRPGDRPAMMPPGAL